MAKKQSGNDLDGVKSSTRDDKGPKVTDLVDLFSFKEHSGKYVTARLHGAIFSYCTYWVTTKTKDGKKTQFPVASPSYDPSTGDFDSTIYDPWLEFARKEKDDGIDPKDRKIRISIEHYANGILRSEQKKEPAKRPTLSKAEKASGFKDKESDSWTPNKAFRLTGGVLDLIKKRSQLNTVESSKTGQTKAYSVLHPKFGADLQIQYDADASSPSKAYDVVLGKRRALTEEEQAELKWDLSDLQPGEKTEDQIRADFEGWARRNGVETAKAKKGTKKSADDYDDNFEDDEEPKSKKAKAKSKARDEEEDEDEDDEEEAPKSKAKSKPSKDEDDDDDFGDDDDDSEEDDDEDEPPKKSKAKAPAKGKKKPADDEDEDEDGDDEEDEDEDDEPPAKSKSKATSKRKPADDEDEDEEEDEDDEDDDEPPAKSKSKSKSKAKTKSSKDEDDDDDFGDDDEDDEPKSKSKKASAKKTSAKSKRKPADDEDEDEDDDE